MERADTGQPLKRIRRRLACAHGEGIETALVHMAELVAELDDPLAHLHVVVFVALIYPATLSTTRPAGPRGVTMVWRSANRLRLVVRIRSRCCDQSLGRSRAGVHIDSFRPILLKKSAMVCASEKVRVRD